MLPSPVLIREFETNLILSCYGTFTGCPWEAFCFVKGKVRRVDLGERKWGEGLGRVEAGETTAWMQYMREQKLKKKKNEISSENEQLKTKVRLSDNNKVCEINQPCLQLPLPD